MLWHVFNVVVILDQCVGIFPFHVSCLETSSENLRVLLVKVNKNSCKTDFLSSIFPETFKSVGLNEVFHDSKLAPVAQTIFIFPKTLCTNTIFRSKGAVWINPGMWQSGVELFIVICLKR
jgi:hypothetical protein